MRLLPAVGDGEEQGAHEHGAEDGGGGKDVGRGVEQLEGPSIRQNIDYSVFNWNLEAV